MTYAGDGFALPGRDRGQQRPGRAEEKLFQLPFLQLIEQIPAQNASAAPAAGAARVNVLLFYIEDHQTAVVIYL